MGLAWPGGHRGLAGRRAKPGRAWVLVRVGHYSYPSKMKEWDLYSSAEVPALCPSGWREPWVAGMGAQASKRRQK